MAHAERSSLRRCKRRKYSIENVAREPCLRGSDSNDLMKVYINPGIGKLLLVGGKWGVDKEGSM